MIDTAPDVKQKMRALRRLFYLSAALDIVGLAILSIAILWFFPSRMGLFTIMLVGIPLALWHQTGVRKKMCCPACGESLYETDGIALHAKTCFHCKARLR